MLHSIYDLTTFCRQTTGDVPAKLVGASTTVVGSKMYLFGGRLVTERRMVSDLYVFDLETFYWERIPAAPDDDVPRARYFHSADTWSNHLIIFGGMSNQPDSPNPDELCVLNDVRFFDLATRRWLPSAVHHSLPPSDPLVPRARYAHLSSVTADRLFIIGGQDFFNTWLDDVCVYDLVTRTWVQRRDYPRHCGTYRSVAVASSVSVRMPQEELKKSPSSSLGPPGARFQADKGESSPGEFTPSESLVHLPYSAPPSEDHPNDIFLYSNYNFTDVKRELEVFSPLPPADFSIHDRSSAMAGTTFPPGLRFPTGAILGNHLIIAGTYLAHSYQSFSIWVLDLSSMTWSRIDPGKAVETGSWFRGCLCADANKFMIFGNRNGNLVDDYNRRLLSWDHVAVVDLEAFGIYQPPPLRLDIRMQELGLAALEEHVLTDFEILCDDGRKIGCSRKVLEERWPWFKDQLRRYLHTASATLETLPASSMHVALPELPGATISGEPRPDPRLTPRAFALSEPYPITLALLQYMYSTALLTPLQHAPAVLSQLLVLATNYRIAHLEDLVRHAMHRALSNSTSVGVYEVATLCSCRSLQIRALKTVMSYTQKRPPRTRQDKEGSGSNRPPDGGAGGSGGGPPHAGGGNSGPSGDSKYISRPRGTSDAKWRHMGDGGVGSNFNYNTRAPQRQLSQGVILDKDSEGRLPPLSVIAAAPTAALARAPSVLSVRTDDDLHAYAELLESIPLVDHRRSLENDHNTGNTVHDEDLATNLSIHSKLEFADDILGQEQEFPAPPPLSSSSSFSESEFSDDHGNRRYFHGPTSGASRSGFHLPRPRLRHIDTYGSDSEAPSLTSSTSRSSLSSSTSRSHSHSSPITPITPSLPTEPPSTLPYLAMIDERALEDYAPYHRLRRAGSPDTIMARDSSKEAIPRWPTQKSNIHWISTDDTDGEALLSPLLRRQVSQPSSSPSGFSRFLKPRRNTDTGPSALSTALASKSLSSLPIDSKALKKEEKRRKKDEIKARREQLAYDLRKSADERAQTAERRSNNSDTRKPRREEGVMFGGIAGSDLGMNCLL